MRHMKSIKDGCMIGGGVLALVMALPLALLLFFTLRLVLPIGGVVVVVLGAVAYAFSPTARAWLEVRSEQQLGPKGDAILLQ